MPAKKKTTKTNSSKRKKPITKRALSRQDIELIKKLKTRTKTVFEAIKELAEKTKNKKKLEKEGNRIFGEKIEAIAVFSRYTSYYPFDEQAVHHPKVYRNLLTELLKKKSTLSTNKYQEFLTNHLWTTYRRIAQDIKSIQRTQG